MAVFSTKHKGRENTFRFRSFTEGLNTDVSALMLPTTALSKCRNMKYALSKDQEGNTRIILKKRQGTELISATALPDSADVMACTYYVAQSQYILATATKLFYLDGSEEPVEIGTDALSGVPNFTEYNGKLIIHDSGITKAWNGTTLTTINSLVDDENLGTGNNSTVDFTGTLANIPVEPGTVVISFTDTTAKTITDDGLGVLEGDVAADTNTINYTTGEYSFRCDGAPDTSTSVTVTYEKVDGAPKSTAGIVRAGCLYLWGDSDNPSRLWYSGTNDEEAWDSSTSGGYIDVDPLDGYSLTGAMNFFETMVLVKGNSLHRLDNFPGDTDFAVIPLMSDIGSVSGKTCLNDGELITFMSNEGWVGMAATQRFGDIQKTADFSEKFRGTAVRYANSSAYSDYNQVDKQLWLQLYDGSNYLPDIYVINLATGGQLSLYKFVFGHSCFKYVNGEMLIGGTDGNLYRLVDDDSTFLDDGESYADTTQFRSCFTEWELPFNRKHNKKLVCYAYGKGGITANIKLYKDQNYVAFSSETLPFTATVGDRYINPDGTLYYIYDLTDYINSYGTSTVQKKKFNYQSLMFEMTDIEGTQGAEFYGADFFGAVIGG